MSSSGFVAAEAAEAAPCRVVAIVDDERTSRDLLAAVAREAGYAPLTFRGVKEFEEGYRSDICLVMTDLMMGDEDGIELMRFLASVGHDAPIVVVSGSDSSILEAARQVALARGLNIRGVLKKPFRLKEIKEQLDVWSAPAIPLRRRGEKAEIGEEDLRGAIIGGLVIPHFQPKIALESELVTGVEALARWRCPDGTIVTPDRFIPLAEETGLITPLTECILDRTLRQCAAWNAQGMFLEVAVNVSARSLTDIGFPERVLSMLRRYEVEPAQLTIEITETTVAREAALLLDIMTRLRMRGVRLSIDDFGTGHSNLAELQKLPFCELKIDRSFVANCLTDKKSLGILDATLSLAKQLGLKAVAEGVEDREQLAALRKLGCDQVQGYLFSRPVAGLDATALNAHIAGIFAGTRWLRRRPRTSA